MRVNDRGPDSPGRVIDLSRAAAEAIDMVGLGIKQVALTVVDKDRRHALRRRAGRSRRIDGPAAGAEGGSARRSRRADLASTAGTRGRR